ncbi:hypothetical protein CYK37_05990 [Mesorhizobium loti]|nr:hypothetical protein [Mesorhizobium loti]PLP60670.1 hypothetical protein CYK37_05990 [Mesorhizobium loti]
MSQRIIQLSSFDIRPGKLEQFKEAIRKAVAFAEAQGPQLVVETFIDEDSLRAHSLQVMPSSEAILAHWKIADPHIREVMESCIMRRLDVYGEPNEEVMLGLLSLIEQGIPVTVTPAFVGFRRGHH